MKTKDFVVTIEWGWEDIKVIRPSWSDDMCRLALQQHGQTLREHSIDAGWDILKDLLED